MSSGYIPSSGMTMTHFAVFQKVAQKTQRIILVRNTNMKCVPWIDKNYPPKPKSIEALHTSAKTGKVTAMNHKEREEARNKGFYVIDDDGIARRKPHELLQRRFAFNTPELNEPGQVIDPREQKALVGDYDLMGVIDPTAPGRVIALHSSMGEEVRNRTNPDVTRVINELNAQMGRKRVMHGPQDLYKSFRGPCTAFLPNGMTWALSTEQAVRSFYETIGRETITGSYRR